VGIIGHQAAPEVITRPRILIVSSSKLGSAEPGRCGTVPGVALSIQCFDLDTPDPDRVASFWEAALGWRRTHDTPDEVVLEPPAGSPEDGVVPDLLFLRVPEGKAVKNRWHPDLRPDDQAAEVARLESLGARRIDVGQDDGASWVVMADPDGNEFCVLRAFTDEELAEIAAGSTG
jgi:predicted enzyme related to lactoylglutathione lyase